MASGSGRGFDHHRLSGQPCGDGDGTCCWWISGRRHRTLIRHAALPLPIAAAPLGMQDPATVGRLIPGACLPLALPPCFKRTIVTAVHLATVTAATNVSLHPTAEAKKEPAGRPLLAPGAASPRHRWALLCLLVLHHPLVRSVAHVPTWPRLAPCSVLSRTSRLRRCRQRHPGQHLRSALCLSTGRDAGTAASTKHRNSTNTNTTGHLDFARFTRFSTAIDNPRLAEVLARSKVFGKLDIAVMSCFSTKYALSLYERIARRERLQYIFHEEFSLEAFREALGVPKNKLSTYGNLHKRAIQPALTEINAFAGFAAKVQPVKSGRKVVGLKLAWWRKNDEEIDKAWRLVRQHSSVRRATVNGTAEMVVDALE